MASPAWAPPSVWPENIFHLQLSPSLPCTLGVWRYPLHSQIQHHPSQVWGLSRGARPPLLRSEGKGKRSCNLVCHPGQEVNSSSLGICSVLGWGQVPLGLRGASHGVVLSSCCPEETFVAPSHPEPLNQPWGQATPKGTETASLMVLEISLQPCLSLLHLVYHPGTFPSLDSLGLGRAWRLW